MNEASGRSLQVGQGEPSTAFAVLFILFSGYINETATFNFNIQYQFLSILKWTAIWRSKINSIIKFLVIIVILIVVIG